MSFRDALRNEPHRFDFLATMRELERSYPKKPRVGDSSVIAEDIVLLGQDPFLEFPASNISSYADTPSGIPRVQTRFLGFFGPQGALPLNTTMEAHAWSSQRDPSFARFVDIIANRFLQLFYRAWADARPIAHFDRPSEDRFIRYIGSLAGFGSEPWLERDTVEDIAKIPYAGLTAAAQKTASRLRELIRGIFKIDVQIAERMGSWLTFEPGDRMTLGAKGSALGVDTFLGQRSYSINDKIRVCIRAKDLDEYRAFLPSGAMAEKLADLVFFYIGHRFEFDVELAIPLRHAPAVQLGVSGEIGWTTWLPSQFAGADDEEIYLNDARFDPMERARETRATTKSQH